MKPLHRIPFSCKEIYDLLQALEGESLIETANYEKIRSRNNLVSLRKLILAGFQAGALSVAHRTPRPLRAKTPGVILQRSSDGVPYLFPDQALKSTF